MALASEATIATLVAVVVTASLPCYLYGAWIILQSSVVTWDRLVHHLKWVGLGLLLTTVPVLVWMVPRLFSQFDSFAALHAILGVQAYAVLLFGLTGIVRIFQVKREHDAYRNPDPEQPISDLHEHMDAWRFRLRVGVFGYLLLWLLAWLVGMARYVLIYR